MGRAADLSGAGEFAANRAVGNISLCTEADGAISRRTRAREEGSLRVRVRVPGPPAHPVEAVLINTAGGVTGDDTFAVDASIGENASHLMTTASAEKIYHKPIR